MACGTIVGVLLLLLFTLVSCPAVAQGHTGAGIAFGYHGTTESYLEMGLGVAHTEVGGHCNPKLLAYGASAGVEMRMYGETVIMPQVSAFATLLIGTVGLSVLYYDHAETRTAIFRPELGLGILTARFVWAFNAPLTKGLPPGISDHEIGIRVLIPAVRIGKEKR